jgi:hypothetical protein
VNVSPNYQAYLLRLWQAGDGDQPQWRASLEDPRNGEVRGFSSLEEMFAFIWEMVKEGEAQSVAENHG